MDFRLNMRDAITPAQREKLRQLMMNRRPWRRAVQARKPVEAKVELRERAGWSQARPPGAAPGTVEGDCCACEGRIGSA